MKQCTKCKKLKENTEFSKMKKSKDGLQSKCRSCTNQYYIDNSHHIKQLSSKHRANNIEYYRKYNKQYNIDNAEQLKQYRDNKIEYIKVYNRQYNINNAEQINQYQKQYAQDNPQKIKARHAVHNAIRRGDLPKAKILKCNRCDKQAREYHHWSYLEEHWLSVEELCGSCHSYVNHDEIN